MSKPHAYKSVPKGCRFNTNTTQRMEAVDLDELAERGSRAQRRWAQREIVKLKNKTGGKS